MVNRSERDKAQTVFIHEKGRNITASQEGKYLQALSFQALSKESWKVSEATIFSLGAAETFGQMASTLMRNEGAFHSL